MSNRNTKLYEFGPFRLDAAERRLLRAGEPVPLTEKHFNLLAALVERGGHLVEKDDLLREVWADAFVEESNLTRGIYELRQALGRDNRGRQYIETVPKHGYRFVADVREVVEGGGPELPEAATATGPTVELSSGSAGAPPQTSPPIVAPRRFGFGKRQKAAALVVLFALAACVAAALFLSNRRAEPEAVERVSVAVVDFDNETGEAELSGLSGMLITSLEQSRRLSVLTRSRMFDILKQLGRSDAERIDEMLGREICERAQVSALVIASIRKFDGLYTIDLKVLDPRKDRYLFTASEKGEDKASIPGMIDRLSERTREGLRENTAEIQTARHRVADITTPNLDAYRHYFTGERLFGVSDFDGAAEEFNQALALDQEFALAQYHLAYIQGYANLERAKEPLRKAMQHLDRTPEKERYMIRAMNAYVETNFDAAAALYREALRLYPDFKEAHWAFGDFAFHNGKYDEALIHLNKVLELDPTFDPAMEHLVWLSREAGDHDRMVQYAKRWVEQTRSEDAYVSLCDAYKVRGDFESALEVNRQLLAAFPNSYRFARCAGDTYILMNKYGKAEAEFKKLLDESRPLPHRWNGYRWLAMLYAYEGRYREAVWMADQSIETASKAGGGGEAADRYVEKAYLLLVGHGDREAAQSAISKQVELNDGSNFGYHVLFNLYLLLGEYEKAAPIVKSQLLTVGPFGDLILDGYIHRAEGEYDVAIRDFEAVAQRGFVIDKIMRSYELAECYYDTGQDEKAIVALRRTQGLYSQLLPFYRAAIYPRSFYLLGKIYERKGDRKLAAESYEKFLSLWKDADRDLPELLDAKSRLASLKGKY